jgi:hypothetical protein
MTLNNIGKFEMRSIVNEFDANLIELFGLNMTDAGITRYEVINIYNELQSTRQAAETYGRQRGLQPLERVAS